MRSVLLSCALLAVITLAVFWQVGSHDFINFDDDTFITDNVHVATGLSLANLAWAMAPTPGIGWFPLTWVSHMVDVELFGLNPGGHHLTNLFLHTTATLLLFLLLLRMSGALWRSAVVAALFALHPLHVESVAWLAERRDVLSACFGFLSLWLYAGFAATRSRKLYALALGAFVLGLMSKQLLVVVPLLMLLFDFWPLKRYGWEGCEAGALREGSSTRQLPALLKEKIPFFACAAITALITLNNPPLPGSFRSIDEIPFWSRAANAAIACLKYVGKMLWPSDLAVFYPFPREIPVWQVAGALMVLAAISLAVVRQARRRPYLPVGWFWFLLLLLPSSGLVQFGQHAMADRYTYLSLTGLFIIVVWGVADLTAGLARQREIIAVLAGVVLTAVTILTWRQLHVWRDSITLFRHTLQVTGDNPLIHNNLGFSLAVSGQLDEALDQYRQAIALAPAYYTAYNNYGLALAEQGDLAGAIAAFRRTLEINPNFFDAHNNLGIAYARQGRLDEALGEFRRAIDLNAEYYVACNNYGLALMDTGRLGEALAAFRRAAVINPRFFDAHFNEGVVLAELGRLDEALAAYGKALVIEPANPAALDNYRTVQMRRSGGR